MSEKSIQQVLEIEKQAQAIHEAAVREAQLLPVQAEQEAQALIEKAKADAQAEAQRLVAQAQADEQTSRITSDGEAKNKQTDAVAKKNFDRAVNYILDRVVGGK
jgi:cell division septum initiation protein DivIVA